MNEQINTPPIGGWLKNSFIDFPGMVSTVLFFQGCNLRCPYCHNRALVTGTPSLISIDKIVTFLQNRHTLIDGVVFSGGEPTIHEDGIIEFARQIRKKGMKLKLDTNGLKPTIIERIAPDYLALDLKTTPDHYHQLGWQGAIPSKELDASLSIVKEMGSNAEVRITVAFPIVDDAVIASFRTMLNEIHTVYLQYFENRGTCINPDIITAVDEHTMEWYKDILSSTVKNCIIRGKPRPVENKIAVKV